MPSQGTKNPCETKSKARAALFTYFRFLSQITSVMASFREIRSILLQSFDDGDISEDEFLLLYDDNLMKQEHAFWLVLSCDLLEDRHIDHVNTYFFNQIKQMHSMLPWVCRKCVKNISDTLSCASCATLQFLSNFYDIYNPLLNRCTKTQNL